MIFIPSPLFSDFFKLLEEKKIRKHAEIQNFQIKYKTEICKNWMEKGECIYEENCSFAHGYHEIREKNHLPSNYKTKKCKNFFENGFCSYGFRCQFLHIDENKNTMKFLVNLTRKMNDFLTEEGKYENNHYCKRLPAFESFCKLQQIN